jgi:PAS domain S-box-containing protein
MIDGCQIISPDFHYIYVNRTVARQGHSTKEKLIGRAMMDVYPGIEKTEMFTHLKQCMKHRKLQRIENEFTYPDGGKAWFELKMEPVPEGVLIFSEDITRRKLAEQSLMTAMEDLRKAKDEINLEKITDRAILESIGEGLIAIDSKARIIMLNEMAERLLGLSSTKLRGLPITKLAMLDEEGRRIPSSKRPIYEVLHGGKSIGPSMRGYYFTHKDKGKFPVGLTATPIRLDGKIIGAIEIFRDITRELETDRAKTEFVSIASHQLRTPLGLTKWYLEAMREEGLDTLSNVAMGYFEEVCKSNARVLKIVRELLSVSRVEQGRIRNDPKQVSPGRLIKEIVEELRPSAAEKNVKLVLSTGDDEAPNISIDRLRLHEVIQNLIVNAIEYTPSGGRVRVSVGKKGGLLIFSVSDTGMGIDEKDIQRLFTKFFRSESASLRNPDGSGLGLYIVKSYAESWGGTVDVKSRPGKGTIFTLTLPYKEGVRYAKNINR